MHLHSSKAHSIGAISVLVGNSTDLVVTRRVMFDIKKSAFSLWKYRLKAVKKVIAISQAIHSHLLSYGLPKDKLRKIYSGISLSINSSEDQVSIREEFNIPASQKIVGNVSALTQEKDLFTFLKVANSVLQKQQNVKFIIFGNGHLEDKLKLRSQELGIAEHIIFAGFRKNVRSVISEFDIFLFTSKTEGLGTSVLDAMVAGTPVVTTDAGGLKEIVTQGHDGYIAGVGDVESLAKWTIKLLNNDSLREKIGHLAKQSVKKFDIKKMGNETILLYDEIMKNERS
jgi:glycosyltransferase involved in cell wall biosynthesis